MAAGAALGAQPRGEIRREEADRGLDPRLRRRLGDRARRVDAQHREPGLLEKAEQGAVVGADVQRQGARRGCIAPDQLGGVVLEMAHEDRRGPGDIDIILEQQPGIDDVEHLQMEAALAEEQVEREDRLRLVPLGRRHEGIGRRGRRERQHQFEIGAGAEPAIGAAVDRGRHGVQTLIGGMRTTSAS